MAQGQALTKYLELRDREGERETEKSLQTSREKVESIKKWKPRRMEWAIVKSYEDVKRDEDKEESIKFGKIKVIMILVRTILVGRWMEIWLDWTERGICMRIWR